MTSPIPNLVNVIAFNISIYRVYSNRTQAENYQASCDFVTVSHYINKIHYEKSQNANFLALVIDLVFVSMTQL